MALPSDIARQLVMNPVAASAVVFYDHAITISQEVENIWKRKLSGVTLLFCLNRIVLLLWAGANMWIETALLRATVADTRNPTWNMQAQRGCTVTKNLSSVCTILATVIRAAFTALRVYAIGHRQRTLAVVIFCLSSASALVPIYQLVTLTPSTWFIFRVAITCANDVVAYKAPAMERVERKLSGATLLCIAMSAFVDLLAIVFTWCRTRAAKRPKFENRSSVTDVLLRDGALYFCVLLFLNVITFMDEWGLQALNTYTIYMLEIIAQYQTPLLSITVSHFLLNLRAAAYGTTSISDSQQTVTDIAFNACDRSSQPRPGSFVEPLGASLSDGSDDIDEDRVWDDVLHVRVGSNEEDA